ncbi:acyltransferase family protein [Brachyspira intermedia]|uniref:acyltransferase family protein n=1 Tax=Brachyspira intermedia TaxID=84377 RepID=UPI003006D254
MENIKILKEIKYRNYSIDIIKFIASIFIATLHFNWKFIPQGYLMVELFFIISGIFIFLKRDKYYDSSIFSIIIRKIKNIYPFYILSMLLYLFLIKFNTTLSDIIMSILLIPDIGIGNRIMPGYLWFIGVYFYIYIFYLILLKNTSEKSFILLTYIIVFFTMSILYFYSEGILNRTYENYIFFLPQGFYRGILGIGIGIIIGYFIQNKEIKKSTILTYTIEIIISIFILYFVFRNVTKEYDFISYFAFSLLLILIFIYDNRLLNYIGKKYNKLFSTYNVIYIFHGILILILFKYNFKNTLINLFIYIAILVSISILFKKIAAIITDRQTDRQTEINK